jgi:hypothetical protein
MGESSLAAAKSVSERTDEAQVREPESIPAAPDEGNPKPLTNKRHERLFCAFRQTEMTLLPILGKRTVPSPPSIVNCCTTMRQA